MTASIQFSSVTFESLPEQTVAVVRATVPFADIPAAQRRARALLGETLAHANVRPSSPSLTIWRPAASGALDYAPGVVVAAKFATPPEVSFVTLPAGVAARLRLVGGYERLGDGWAHLFANCAGRQLADLNWEVYTRDGPTSAETQTDLYALLA